MVPRHQKMTRLDRVLILDDIDRHLREGHYTKVAVDIRRLDIMGAPLKGWERMRIDDLMDGEVENGGLANG